MTGSTQRLLWGLVVFVALAVAPASPAATNRQPAPGSGLQLIAETQLSPRLIELRFSSPALGHDTSARVLVPDGFDPTRDHLPVLWLLHGGFGSYRDWTDVGHAEALTAGLPLLVVMPDGGIGGWYSNWRSATPEGPQQWETYDVDELRPFIEAHFQTRTDRRGREIAGLSMGGFGAIHLAARHPDLFGFAAAFSGAVNSRLVGVEEVVMASPLAHQGIPGAIFGDPVTNETTWRANNPVDLAANLATVDVQLRTGNGMTGGPHGGGFDIQEFGVSAATFTLHQRLVELGIPHLYDDYGPGAHSYDYWIDDLAATLPAVVAATAGIQPDPTTVTHLAFEPTFSAWGFAVALDRSALEETVLSVRPDGFGLRGSGRGTVTSPPRFAPGEQVHATGTSSAGAAIDQQLVADDGGRVVVPVDLGPANALDEYLAGVALPRAQVAIDVTLEGQGVRAATAATDTAGAAAAGGSPAVLPATGGSGLDPPLVALIVVALVGSTLSRRLRS